LDARIIVFQCPPSFEPSSENKGNVKKFFSKIKRGKHILAWEPRGRWQKGDIEPLCRDLDLIHVVDPFKSEQTYGEISYYRLHGKGGYRYKYTEDDLGYLRGLVGQGFSLADETPKGRPTSKQKTVYFMFNNVYMFEDALSLKRLVC
jgi:uncharacterized protein YecE (DUF72 family)